MLQAALRLHCSGAQPILICSFSTAFTCQHAHQIFCFENMLVHCLLSDNPAAGLQQANPVVLHNQGSDYLKAMLTLRLITLCARCSKQILQCFTMEETSTCTMRTHGTFWHPDLTSTCWSTMWATMMLGRAMAGGPFTPGVQQNYCSGLSAISPALITVSNIAVLISCKPKGVCYMCLSYPRHAHSNHV